MTDSIQSRKYPWLTVLILSAIFIVTTAYHITFSALIAVERIITEPADRPVFAVILTVGLMLSGMILIAALGALFTHRANKRRERKFKTRTGGTRA